MENQNIMNEAILEEAVETEVINSGKSLTEKVVGIALVAGGVVLAYKVAKLIVSKGIKPAITFLKAHVKGLKKSKTNSDEAVEVCEEDFVEVE